MPRYLKEEQLETIAEKTDHPLSCLGKMFPMFSQKVLVSWLPGCCQVGGSRVHVGFAHDLWPNGSDFQIDFTSPPASTGCHEGLSASDRGGKDGGLADSSTRPLISGFSKNRRSKEPPQF